MKKNLIFTMIIAIAAIKIGVVTVAADPTDTILIAYTLTDAEKGQFSTKDGKASPFWNTDWTGRDSIHLTTTANSYPGRSAWTGPDDAAVIVKAAGDATGLYLNFIVEDNVFVDPQGNRWDMDACDVYLDSLNSDDIRAGGDAIKAQVQPGWSMTRSSQQFQVWMGGTWVPSAMNDNYYNPQTSKIGYNNISFSNLPNLYKGMSIEVYKIDATHKGQEWFIPWECVGISGLKTGEPLSRRRFAFTCGYNDQDIANPAGPPSDVLPPPTVRCLRWKLYDPFSSTAAFALESWGDIEMAPDMPSVHGVSSINLFSGHSFVNNGQVVKTELFNLRGKKIAAGEKSPKNSLVIKRTLSPDGAVISRTAYYAL